MKPCLVYSPWQLVGIDFMGPFKTSIHGNKYIILAIDHFTKFVEGAATVTIDAVTIAFFLFNNIICRYCMIKKLLSDQDRIKIGSRSDQDRIKIGSTNSKSIAEKFLCKIKFL